MAVSVTLMQWLYLVLVFLLTVTSVVLLPVVDDMKRTGYNGGRFDIAEWAR